MDLKPYANKLVGNDTERAVSPVIGVILMVAITVILAAVIAAFVLDMGGSVSQEAQAGVSIEVDDANNQTQIEVTSMGNADYINITGSSGLNEGEVRNMHSVGDVQTLDHDGPNPALETNGTVSAVAVINESDTSTQVASEEWDFFE